MIELIQIVLFYSSIPVLIVQFPAAKCWIYSSKREVKTSSNAGTPMDPRGTNTKQLVTKSSLSIEATIKSTKVTHFKIFAINTNPINSTHAHGEASKLVPPVSQMVTSWMTVPTGNPTMNSQHRSSVKTSASLAPISNHSLGVASLRSSYRRVTITRKRRSSTTATSTTSTIIRPTTDSAQNRSNVTGYSNPHPCNIEVNSSAMEYKVGNIECRRRPRTDLQEKINCLGTFNHQYLATTLQEALTNFTDLDTGGKLNFSTPFVWHHSSGRIRRKRGMHIDPGETLIGHCYASKTLTESGHLRMCPVCTAITRQPSQPRRFPEYINELVCDPAQSNYIPGIDGFCIQKTFTLDLLQFDGDWEKNSALSAKAGHDVYSEKWQTYTQKIKRHCACELLPSSPIASLF